MFGKPNRRFYDQLALFATDPKEKDLLEKITTDDPEGNNPLMIPPNPEDK
jgi:hypothetical protein